eukprot:gnl/TRDRNA2_/TRDRNA2_39927_c0_seq1.p1 gnl/TRDRNA2_/TRDRNA2_39927_c0~~gnl/TRDRNA2_/TRDRNA2_39927_c0_seq1.p1  ORF type:complete len:399 (-),score=53.52 gnl/TRDRNA2_/TRDRNA2_39927_c0_seq1:113-1309(-)
MWSAVLLVAVCSFAPATALVTEGSAGTYRAAVDHRQREVPDCTCARCQGRRMVEGEGRLAGTAGFQFGFQCTPHRQAADLDQCKQVGDRSNWAVQTAPVVDYARFCLFTCKPLVPKGITPNIACEQLSAKDIKWHAQSATGNGRAYVYRSNPMTDSPTLGTVPDATTVASDRVSLMKNAFRAVEAAQASPLDPCECKCEVSLLQKVRPALLTAQQIPAMPAVWVPGGMSVQPPIPKKPPKFVKPPRPFPDPPPLPQSLPVDFPDPPKLPVLGPVPTFPVTFPPSTTTATTSADTVEVSAVVDEPTATPGVAAAQAAGGIVASTTTPPAALGALATTTGGAAASTTMPLVAATTTGASVLATTSGPAGLVLLETGQPRRLEGRANEQSACRCPCRQQGA